MSKKNIIKRILLFFLGIVTSFGTVCANTNQDEGNNIIVQEDQQDQNGDIQDTNIISPTLSFTLKKEKTNKFKRNLYISNVGLTHFRSNKLYQLSVKCTYDNEKEEALTALKTLVYDLKKAGYTDCLIKDSKTNEYVNFYKTESTDGWSNIVYVYIQFRDAFIELIESIYIN